MKIEDIHWIAGLLEGEGCFGLKVSPTHLRAHISLGMTDEDVVKRAASLLKCTVNNPRKLPSGKQMWHLSIHGQRAAAWMMTLWPLLGERRRKRIEEVLSIWKKQRVHRWATPTIECYHEDRKKYAHGLCKQCYHRHHWALRKERAAAAKEKGL